MTPPLDHDAVRQDRLTSLRRPDRFPRSSRYDPAWIVSLDMGPHPLWQLEGLLPDLDLRAGDRVLDLGCGRGATSVFLAQQLGVRVVAVDRWVPAETVEAAVEAAGVEKLVQVVQADARALPFAADRFDAIVSIDAFEYFGTDVHLLPNLLRVLRTGGSIGVSTPALAADPYQHKPPSEVTDLVGWEAAAWHAPSWWQRHWELTGLLADVSARMQPGGREDWLAWAKATGEPGDGPLLAMLDAMAPDQIGFALISGKKI